jgi:hypothetical protein
MTLKGADERLVRLLVDLLDHPTEVADRLVVVDDEGKRNPFGHRSLYDPFRFWAVWSGSGGWWSAERLVG